MASSGAHDALSRGSIVAGKYLLLRPLASGGMGDVWVAQHQQLDIDVAIKFIDPALGASSTMRTRFEREAKAAAKLRTRHVVQILDHGVDGSTPYIVMELLEGEDLRARLRKVRRLSLTQTAMLLRQAAKGLTRAHELGIVHRDLKPANVFLAEIDDEEVLKLLDFGIAKMSATGDGETTRTGDVVGSPNYMSPEQARGTHRVDHRSDLWSLAVILFRCVTGRAPFRGATPADVIVKICAETIPTPSTVAPDLPQSVDAFFERALARNPEQRFASAAEMSAAFEQALDEAGETLVAAPSARDSLPSIPEISPFSWGQRPLLGASPSLGVARPVTAEPVAPVGVPVSRPEAAGQDDVPADQAPTLVHRGDPGTLTNATAAAGPRVLLRKHPWAAAAALTALVCAGGLTIALFAGLGASEAPSLDGTIENPAVARTSEAGHVATVAVPTADAPAETEPTAPVASSSPSSSATATATASSSATARSSGQSARPPRRPAKPAKPKSTQPTWGF